MRKNQPPLEDEIKGFNHRSFRGTAFCSITAAAALSCALAVTGCSKYVSSQEMMARAQSRRTEGREPGKELSDGSRERITGQDTAQDGQGSAISEDATPGGEKSAKGQDRTGGTQGSAGGQAGAPPTATSETSRMEAGRTMAPMPEFEAVQDHVYVKTPDGGSVRIRSACDTADDSNILTYVSPGARLTRSGKNSQWTRVDYNGAAGYISTEYITTEVPEQSASSGNTYSGSGSVTLDPTWKYAEFSKINTGAAVMYRSEAASKKNITVCVNAGHGTLGGSSVKTLCHPDGTPKVTGGTTGAGATSAVAVSGGMTFLDGTPESKVTLAMAKTFKDKLLAAGYDVLMIRESEDVQLDNVARTVIANNASDCHIALHWDSTESNKGAFYMSVPNVDSYRNMEPVKSNWQKHNALGESLVGGLKGAGIKIFSGGAMAMDLTQTSYSTVPSIDIELGDKASDHSQATLDKLAEGLVAGVNQYFGF